MGIYKLWSKKITQDYPWVKTGVVSLYMIWPASDYHQTGHVATGYVQTEAQHKAASFKPEDFYVIKEV